MNKYIKLLNEYESLKDEIMQEDDKFHDGMYYDIMGFWEEIDDEDRPIDELESQVKACRSLLKGLKGLNYTFC